MPPRCTVADVFRRVVPLLLVAAVATSACGDADDGTAAAPAVSDTSAAAAGNASANTAGRLGEASAGAGSTAPTVAAPAGTAASAGTSAPNTAAMPAAPATLQFTAPLVGGGDIDLAGYGGQPVLFWFWAPY